MVGWHSCCCLAFLQFIHFLRKCMLHSFRLLPQQLSGPPGLNPQREVLLCCLCSHWCDCQSQFILLYIPWLLRSLFDSPAILTILCAVRLSKKNRPSSALRTWKPSSWESSWDKEQVFIPPQTPHHWHANLWKGACQDTLHFIVWRLLSWIARSHVHPFFIA